MPETLGNYLRPNTPTQKSSAADFDWEIQDEADRRARGRRLKWVGLFLILIGLAVAPSGFFIPFPAEASFCHFPTIILVIGAMAVFGGVSQIRLSRQYLAPNAEQLLRKDSRPPIVYLRPFDADDTDNVRPELSDYFSGKGTFQEAFGASEEEQLAVAMNELGPFVAIGRPYDVLPKLGAARIRVSDEEWKAKVAEWVSRAQLIVVRVGLTEGVQWEITHIVEHTPPEKLVLLLPFATGMGYDDFRFLTRDIFKRNLPEIKRRRWIAPLSVSGLIYFSADWEPHFVELRRSFLIWIAQIYGSTVGAGIGIAHLAIRPVITLALFGLQPRNWLTPRYKRAFGPVIQNLGLRWKLPGGLHLLKPLIALPLLLGATFLFARQQMRDSFAQSLVTQGEQMFNQNDYNGAIQEFSDALKYNPRSEPALAGRGDSYELSGNHTAAIQDLTAALKIDPNDSRALLGRAFAYEAEGNYAAVIRDLDAALQIDPQDTSALGLRADAYLNSGNCAAAEQDAAAVIAIRPDDQLAKDVRCTCSSPSSESFLCK